MSMKMQIMTCPVCRKKFRSTSKYCSIECKARAWSKRWHRDYDDVLASMREQEAKRVLGLAWRHNKGAEEGWHCHDCGKLSATYRCPECKAKWLKKHGVAPLGEEAHDDTYRLIF